MAFVPSVGGRPDVAFYGVFDGTVGDDASDFVHHVAVQNMVNNKHFTDALKAAETAKRWVDPMAVRLFEAAMKHGYKESDRQLLEHAKEKRLDYTSSTSVTAFVTGDLLTVGHLGDSRIVLGREQAGSGLVGRRLTVDHKPDQAAELKRIQSRGGSLTYLHGGKPFIRGGDFTARQAQGDRPMQLNYSRAFGGKDLKPFGLSSEPTITQIQLTARDKVLILGSDGVWDVMPPDDAVHLATAAREKKLNPAQQIVLRSLALHNARGSIDNVTAIVIFL